MMPWLLCHVSLDRFKGNSISPVLAVRQKPAFFTNLWSKRSHFLSLSEGTNGCGGYQHTKLHAGPQAPSVVPGPSHTSKSTVAPQPFHLFPWTSQLSDFPAPASHSPYNPIKSAMLSSASTLSSFHFLPPSLPFSLSHSCFSLGQTVCRPLQSTTRLCSGLFQMFCPSHLQ